MHTNLASAIQQTLPASRQCGRAVRVHGEVEDARISLSCVHTSHPNPLPVGEGRLAINIEERGTALIFALVMLLMLTLLGITAVTTSSLQEKMAGNMRDQYTAQQAADSILRDGEALVYGQVSRPTPACPPSSAVTQRIWDSGPDSVGNTLCLTNVATATDSAWSGFGYLAAVANNYTSQQPRYVVEHIQKYEIALGKTPKEYRYFYRTTGWSVGFTDSAHALLQSVFSKKTDDYSTP